MIGQEALLGTFRNPSQRGGGDFGSLRLAFWNFQEGWGGGGSLVPSGSVSGNSQTRPVAENFGPLDNTRIYVQS